MADVSLNDPIDRHAVVVPQFELNSYDALNALTMECDTFVEGDLLVTFPQCKDADGCPGLGSQRRSLAKLPLPRSKHGQLKQVAKGHQPHGIPRQ